MVFVRFRVGLGLELVIGLIGLVKELRFTVMM